MINNNLHLDITNIIIFFLFKTFIIGKQILDQLQITDEVSLRVEDSKIIIESVKSKPREKWEGMLLKANSLNDNEVLEYFDNDFDKAEWTW